jgi:hypothetical protein
MEVQLHSFFTSALGGGERSTSLTGPLYLQEGILVSTGKKAERVAKTVWVV